MQVKVLRAHYGIENDGGEGRRRGDGSCRGGVRGTHFFLLFTNSMICIQIITQ